MTIGGFDPNAGVTMVEPIAVEPAFVEPAANVVTIGGFDPNAGITMVEPTPVVPAFPPYVGNVATIGGVDLNGGITVVELGNTPQAANTISIGGRPSGNLTSDLPTWMDPEGRRSLNGPKMGIDTPEGRFVSSVIRQAISRAIEVSLANGSFWGVQLEPSNGTSYDFEGRLQNNTNGTSC